MATKAAKKTGGTAFVMDFCSGINELSSFGAFNIELMDSVCISGLIVRMAIELQPPPIHMFHLQIFIGLILQILFIAHDWRRL